MSQGKQPPEASDALRRRLYRPGATPEDLQRYLAEQPVTSAPPPEAAAPSPVRRPWRVISAAGAAVGLAALALGVLQAERPAADPVPTAPTADAARVLLQQIGEGQVLAVQEGVVSDPTAASVSVRGAAVAGERFVGRGNAVVAVHPPRGSLQGGRAVIELSAGSGTSVAWRALLTETRNETTTYPIVLARGPASASGSTTFVYPRIPPTRIAVTAPAGARWTLVVAIAGGLGPVSG